MKFQNNERFFSGSLVMSDTSVKSEKLPLSGLEINTATDKELKMIPGVGPVMAARIIAARPFRSVDDPKNVNGIGDKKYEIIRPYFQSVGGGFRRSESAATQERWNKKARP
jgi:DNA uptake protein ComE-like DNA-binding protein